MWTISPCTSSALPSTLYRSLIVARVLVSTMSLLPLMSRLIIRAQSVAALLLPTGPGPTSALFSREHRQSVDQTRRCACHAVGRGAVVHIDINDWPSFRGCHPVAATHIAQHILRRTRMGASPLVRHPLRATSCQVI